VKKEEAFPNFFSPFGALGISLPS